MTQKTSRKLMDAAQDILKKHGENSLTKAKEIMLQEKLTYKPIYDAITYFCQEIWWDFHHPALISLACKAVGGNPTSALKIGAAVAMLSGAADIHDDIIDESKNKASKLTVYGKFGKDIALLVGDALLFEGMLFLHEACQKLPKTQGKRILKIIKNAFFEIGVAEAIETSFRGKYDLNPQGYLELIKRKTAVAEACMRVGAILGGGSAEKVKALSHYGRTLGTLMTIRDEFIDTLEPDELKHRIQNECLPLPLLYAFQTSEVKDKIIKTLKKTTMSRNDAYVIAEDIMKTGSVRKLKRRMHAQVIDVIQELRLIKNEMLQETFIVLLKAALEDL